MRPQAQPDVERLKRLTKAGDPEAALELARMFQRSGIYPAELARLATVEKCRRSFAYFVQLAWHIEHGDRRLIWGWHMDAICQHLEAVTRGEIKRLIINVPPGCSKSLLVSVYWQAWEWAFHPATQWLVTSGNPAVVTRDARRARDVVESDWFVELFRPTWGFERTQNAKTCYVNTANGSRTSRSTLQKVVGLRADRIVIDDPLEAREATVDSHALAEHVLWFDEALSDRTNSPDSTIVLIMQRIHEADLSGHLLARGGYEHLCLPAEYDPNRRCVTSIFADPRTVEGELLIPELLPKAHLDHIRRTKGSRIYVTQYQQTPTSPDGNVFRSDWVHHWTLDTLPTEFDTVIASFDSTYKKTKDSHYVVGQVWARLGADYYLLPYFFRMRATVPEHIAAVRNAKRRYPAIRAVLVEGTGNGPAVIEALAREISGVIGVELPKDSKLGRAYAVTPPWESGNVYLPPLDLYSWVGEHFLPEVLGFPLKRYDDQVDAMTQGLDYLVEDEDVWVG